mgnify:FL=1
MDKQEWMFLLVKEHFADLPVLRIEIMVQLLELAYAKGQIEVLKELSAGLQEFEIDTVPEDHGRH